MRLKGEIVVREGERERERERETDRETDRQGERETERQRERERERAHTCERRRPAQLVVSFSNEAIPPLTFDLPGSTPGLRPQQHLCSSLKSQIRP